MKPLTTEGETDSPTGQKGKNTMKTIKSFETLNKSEVKKAIRYFEKKHPETEVIASGWATHPQNECDKDTGFQTVSVELWSEAERESYTVYISVCLWDRRRSFVMEDAEAWYSEPETTNNTNNENEEENNMNTNHITTEAIRDMFALDRDSMREELRRWKDAVSVLDNQCNVDQIDNETPAHTVKCFVQQVGFETAQFIIASLVNRSAWDGRIYPSVAKWADGIEGSLDEQACVEFSINATMHRAHLNQIAQAMMQYTPEEEPEAEEEPEEEDTRSDAQKYADGIAEDLRKLYEANPTDEEREEAEENGEACGIWSYVSDCLDVEYTMDSNGEYLGARIYVTLGGPTAWIDTRDRAVRCVWGTDNGEAWLPSEICDEIDSIFSEQFACLRS